MSAYSALFATLLRWSEQLTTGTTQIFLRQLHDNAILQLND